MKKQTLKILTRAINAIPNYFYALPIDIFTNLCYNGSISLGMLRTTPGRYVIFC